MSRGVDPKNASQRERNDWRITGWLSGLVPRRLYLKEGLVVLSVLAVGFLVYDFSRFVATSDRYRVSVQVKGLEALSKGDVLKEIDGLIKTSDRPRSLVNVSVQAVRSTLLNRIPRFKNVQVQKDYPETLSIRVEERKPVALIARRTRQGDESTVYLPIDREGVIFRPTRKEVKNLPDQVPVVRGFSGVQDGTPSFDRRWNKALKVLDAVEKRFSSDLLEWVEVRTGGYVQMRINHPKPLDVRLGETRYARKLDKLKTMMQTNQFLNINKYVNLTQLENVRAL